MKEKNQLPIYSLQNFIKTDSTYLPFSVERFDANRHFAVQYPHRHDFFEVLYLYQGSGFYVIDNNKYEINPPCVFFLSPGQAHKLELSTDIEGYIYIFTSEFYLINQTNQNRLLEFPFFYTINQTNPPLLLNNEDDKSFIEELFRVAIKNLEEKNFMDIQRSILDLLLVYAASLYKLEEPMVNKGKGHILVKRFYQLVEENYQKNYSVNDYASLLAITPNHLTQTVKILTGKTTNSIIQEKQVLEIKRLLVHTNMGVSEISNTLNFSDQSYFTKFFKKMTGLTPLRFRMESMKNT
jgi:AraC-like DNA-binding protein/mannose-6-phosphate isomerase-like protein (cupin superfamily)